MNAELDAKLSRVRSLLKEQNASAMLVGLQSNFSWLACGGEAHVPLNTDRSFGELIVTPRHFYLLANRIEMRSLQDEVVRGLGAKPLLWEWHDAASALKLVSDIDDPKRILSDTGNWGTNARPDLIQPLHYSLLPQEVKRYRTLGKLTEAAITEACRAIKPGQTEFEIAGQLCAAAWKRQITPVVVLVATDERIHNYRHPRPTKKKLKRHAMLVLCARQNGLIVPMTRIVHFGKVPKEVQRRHLAVCAVDAALQQSTRVGTPVKDVFKAGVAAYTEQGFAGEWSLHHQGGPCGYQGRDYLGNFDAPGVVLENQPYAWNPSITGSKSEDTILATSKGPVVITESKDWPMVEVPWNGKTVKRPDILVR